MSSFGRGGGGRKRKQRQSKATDAAQSERARVLSMVADPRTRMYISQITPVYLPSQTYHLLNHTHNVMDPNMHMSRRDGHAVVSRYVPIGHHRMSTLRIRLFDILLFERKRFNGVLAKHASRYGEMLAFLTKLPQSVLRRLVQPHVAENNLRAAFLQHLLRDFHVRRLARDQAWTLEYGRTLEPLAVDKDPSLVTAFQEDGLITSYLRVLQVIRDERLKAQAEARRVYQERKQAALGRAVAAGEAAAFRPAPLPVSVVHAQSSARARARAQQAVAKQLREQQIQTTKNAAVATTAANTADAAAALVKVPAGLTAASPASARRSRRRARQPIQAVTGRRLTARARPGPARRSGADRAVATSGSAATTATEATGEVTKDTVTGAATGTTVETAEGTGAMRASRMRGGGFRGSVTPQRHRIPLVEGDSPGTRESPSADAGTGWGEAEDDASTGRHEDMLRVVGMSPTRPASSSPHLTLPVDDPPHVLGTLNAGTVENPTSQPSVGETQPRTAEPVVPPVAATPVVPPEATDQAPPAMIPTQMPTPEPTPPRAAPERSAGSGRTRPGRSTRKSGGKKRKHNPDVIPGVRGVSETSLLLLFTAMLERRVMINLLTEKYEGSTTSLCGARRQAEGAMARLDPHDVHKFFAVPYCESTQQCLQLLLQRAHEQARRGHPKACSTYSMPLPGGPRTSTDGTLKVTPAATHQTAVGADVRQATLHQHNKEVASPARPTRPATSMGIASFVKSEIEQAARPQTADGGQTPAAPTSSQLQVGSKSSPTTSPSSPPPRTSARPGQVAIVMQSVSPPPREQQASASPSRPASAMYGEQSRDAAQGQTDKPPSVHAAVSTLTSAPWSPVRLEYDGQARRYSTSSTVTPHTHPS